MSVRNEGDPTGSGESGDPLAEKLHGADKALRRGLGGCLTLAGLALSGIAALVLTMIAGLKLFVGDADWWPYLVAAVVLATFALLVWSRLDRVAESTTETVEKGRVDTLRDAQQASGEVTGAGQAFAKLQLWASGVVIAAIGIGVALSWNAEWASKPVARWVMLGVAIAGATFAVKAIMNARRAREAGSSTLRIDNPPVNVGGRLAGRVTIGLGSRPRKVTLKLVCQRVTIDKSARIRHRRRERWRKVITPLWEDERQLPISSLHPEGGGRWSLPVSWDIPGDALPTDESDPENKIQWMLRLEATRGDEHGQQDGWEITVRGRPNETSTA